METSRVTQDEFPKFLWKLPTSPRMSCSSKQEYRFVMFITRNRNQMEDEKNDIGESSQVAWVSLLIGGNHQNGDDPVVDYLGR